MAAFGEGEDKFSPEFSLWLSGKLQDLNVDHEVYGTYISGILDSAETEEEKSEALIDFLSEFVEEAVEETCAQIVQTWLRLSARAAGADRANQPRKKTVASVMEKQAATVVKKQGNEENAATKQALLAQYAEVSDEEDEGYTGDTREAVYGGKDLLGFKNMNKTNVQQAEKQAREKAKEEVRNKKEKDKLQREKDKQKAAERKEKEKKRTQKGERRR